MNYYQPFILLVALSLLVSFNYISAWTVPGSYPPPNGNVATPVNTGSVDQTKVGAFTSNESLTAPSIFSTDTTVVDWLLVQAEDNSETYPTNGLALDVNGKIGGTDYCNEDGLKFIPAGSLYENRFGGMYTMRADEGECLTANAYTGSCSCPNPPFFVPQVAANTGTQKIFYCTPPL